LWVFVFIEQSKQVCLSEKKNKNPKSSTEDWVSMLARDSTLGST